MTSRTFVHTTLFTLPGQARPSRGFSTPYDDTVSVPLDTLRSLDRFYAHANRELCDLMASLSGA